MKYIKGAFYFVYKLYVTLLFIVTAIIFFPILTFATSKEKLHQFAFKTFAFWSIFFRVLVLWPFQIKGKENIKKGSFIIISNHSSYADIFIWPSLMRKYPHVFLGKSEILSYPIIKNYFINYNIPVYRGNKEKNLQTIKEAKNKLSNGWSIVIFPEGGFPDHKPPKMGNFKAGAFKLAKDTNTEILPLTLVNNYELYSDPTKPFASCRPGFCKVVFHPIITLEEIHSKSIDELMKQAYDTIESGLNQK
jgi:1-acyl-sn-glycerol-3-phosphate acyltransferase